MTEKDKSIYMAKLAEQAERYEGMCVLLQCKVELS